MWGIVYILKMYYHLYISTCLWVHITIIPHWLYDNSKNFLGFQFWLPIVHSLCSSQTDPFKHVKSYNFPLRKISYKMKSKFLTTYLYNLALPNSLPSVNWFHPWSIDLFLLLEHTNIVRITFNHLYFFLLLPGILWILAQQVILVIFVSAQMCPSQWRIIIQPSM